MFDIRQMSASTPPSMNEETRVDLPDESQIPLPSSVASSEYGQDDSPHVDKSLPAEDDQAGTKQEITGPHDQEAETAVGAAQLENQAGLTLDVLDSPTPHGDPTYTTPELPVSLLELVEVMEEDKYQSRRLITLQDEAYGLFHKCGSCDRFFTVQTHLYRRMVECFRSDKKNAFASLYGKAMSYPSFAELEVPTFGFDDTPEALGSGSRDFALDGPWITRLPSESQKGLMEFLANIRTDPSFAAERIYKLPESRLKKLARPHRQHAPGESVLPTGRGYGRYDPRGFQRSMAKPGDPIPSVDDMMGDPLMLLINGVFDSSSGPRSPERLRQLNVWSSICCRLIEGSKPGSDDFCITVLDAFAEMSEWPAAPRMELFLAEIIASGIPLLENQGGQGSIFTQSSNPQQVEDDQLVSNFFLQAIHSLLDLVVDDPYQSIPCRALELIRSILHKIGSEERRITARNFFFLRWYCASFLHSAIILPESHGIMMEHSLSNHVRQNILRELVVRLQRVIKDVLSPWLANPVSPALEAKVRKLLSAFEQEPSTTSGPYEEDLLHQDRLFLFLRPEDVLAVARSLSSDGYTDSASTSMFEPPSSRASSVFGLPSFAPGPVFSGIGDVPYAQGHSGSNAIQSNTWHAPSFGGRPSITDSGYGTFESQLTRPGSSGGLLGDLEKESSFPFIHDLWLLTANRELQGAGPNRRHEAAVLFIDNIRPDLSLSPFQPQDRIESDPCDSSGNSSEFFRGMHYGDSALLAAALTRITEKFRRSNANFGQRPGTIESMRAAFDRNLEESRSKFDYQSEYFWWNCVRTLEALNPNTVLRFLAYVLQQRRTSADLRQNLGDQYEEWLYILRRRSAVQDQVTQRISLCSKRLRNKMWYVSDVRHSSAYEDAYNITRALKAMVESTEKRGNGVAAWAKQRIRNSFGHERVLSQTLELMSAPKTYGGPNKLSESQVQITTEWLLTDSIENFCRGEERIHRFCYEIQKCVKRLAGEAMLDSPVLWSSPLFQIEKSEHGVVGNYGHSQRPSQDHPSWNTDFSHPHTWNMGPTHAAANPGLAFQGAESPSSLHAGLSTPTTFNNTAHGFGASPQMQSRPFIPRNWALPPSPISPGNIKTSTEGSSLRRRAFLQNLRAHLTSLLLSDLGSILWSQGSETDRWITGESLPPRAVIQSQTACADQRAGSSGSNVNGTDLQERLGRENSSASDNPRRSKDPTASKTSPQTSQSFNFAETFKVLLKRFQLSPDPQSKLQYLYELFLLAGYRCQAEQYQISLRAKESEDDRPQLQDNSSTSFLGRGVPRTRLTRLQEVTANCEDRRIGSLTNIRSVPAAAISPGTGLPTPQLDDPALTALIQAIFADSDLRPSTFFRDLQFIASLTPSSTLDYTPQGTAFWTIGIAAMSVKSTKCKSMTDSAMQILEFHYGSGNQKEPTRLRQGSQDPVTAKTSSPSPNLLSRHDLSGTTLQDAASLLTVSALEGDPAAARELALFHLTHPELVSRATLPLSRPSDVFRIKHGGASERGHGRNGSSGAGEDSGVLDPITFHIVFHWMEFAANAGDADAMAFFKENEVLGKAL